jgi:hypothetical protein
VDRGAWGVETLALLLAWKVALPRHVLLLRGNHESTYCTKYYGFQGELTAKYSARDNVGDGAAAGGGDAPMAEAEPDPQAQPGAEAAHEADGEGQQQAAEADGDAGRRPKRASSRAAAAKAVAAVKATARKQQSARKELEELIKASRRLFALLPLGALVGSKTLVLHGGLFRAPPSAGLKGKQRRAVKAGVSRLGWGAGLGRTAPTRCWRWGAHAAPPRIPAVRRLCRDIARLAHCATHVCRQRPRACRAPAAGLAGGPARRRQGRAGPQR